VRSHLLLPEDESFLAVLERVRITSHVRREKYSYHLRLEGQNVGRWDFEPVYGPDSAYHVNPMTGEQHLIPAERVTVVQVVEMSWVAHAEWHNSSKKVPPDIWAITRSHLNL